eukprot:scaffold7998_cov417-Prasinococcus_capsulatus_cf.AAC.9
MPAGVGDSLSPAGKYQEYLIPSLLRRHTHSRSRDGGTSHIPSSSSTHAEGAGSQPSYIQPVSHTQTFMQVRSTPPLEQRRRSGFPVEDLRLTPRAQPPKLCRHILPKTFWQYEDSHAPHIKRLPTETGQRSPHCTEGKGGHLDTKLRSSFPRGPHDLQGTCLTDGIHALDESLSSIRTRTGMYNAGQGESLESG